MKINYTKKRLKSNLIQGCVWGLFALVGLWTTENMGIWIGWGLIAGLFIGTYFFERKNQYLTLENGFIRKNTPFCKSLNLAEVRRIKKFAGDYILITESEKLTINTLLIDPTSLELLDKALSAVELPPQLTPFSRPA